MANAENLIEHWLDNSVSAAARAARCVAERLRNGIGERGVAAMAVSGGRSPIAFFQELAKQELPWEKVSITLVDERWVPADSGHSNERLIREHLLRDAAAAAKFVPLKTHAENPQEALGEIEVSLKQLAWPLDVVVLGMGEDGHTASLFPGAINLADALDTSRPNRLVAIQPPQADHARMSLTLRGLLQTRCIVLLIQNGRKRAVYLRANNGADAMQYPIAAVLRQREVPVEVFWSP